METQDTSSKYRALGMDALYLASCALHEQCPQWEQEGDLDGLFRFCKFHTITAITAMALERYWKEHPPADPETAKPWLQSKDKTIRKNILLNAEREALERELDAMGCWHMSLKGSRLQYDYPRFGMREMSDNDILFDPEMRDQVRDLMCSRGYNVSEFRESIHDTYDKPPVYHMEMHAALFKEANAPELAAYYRDTKSRLISEDGSACRLRFTDEDFYIYVVAHAYKHYVCSGTGIRHLLDLWVYSRRHENLDWDYIRRELHQFGAAEFEENSRNLGHKFFDRPNRCPELTQAEESFLTELLTAGTFGTTKIGVNNKVKKAGGRGSYLFSWLFPSLDALRVLYPCREVHGWMVPLFWLSRWVGALLRPARSIRVLRSLFKSK